MIKCGKLKGKDGEVADQCILYAKDGSKALGYFLYSEHGGQKGAKAAAHKREGAIQFFKQKHQGLLDALDAFGAPVVLKYLLDRAADCEACQEVVKSYVEKAQGEGEGQGGPEPEEGDEVEKKAKEPPYGGSFSRMWSEVYGGSVKKCIEMIKGQKNGVTDPGAYCAWMKDKALKRTTWRGKGHHEKKSFAEEAEEALTMLEKDEEIDLSELERWLGEVGDDVEPEGDAEPEPATEPETAEPEPEPEAEELPNDFRTFLLQEHAMRRAGVLAMLEEVEDNG